MEAGDSDLWSDAGEEGARGGPSPPPASALRVAARIRSRDSLYGVQKLRLPSPLLYS